METEKVNSMGYWNRRFDSGDWEKYDGNKQSEFFGRLAIDAMPLWLIREMSRNTWTVADVGCAEGGGTAALARRFPACQFTGLDFSGEAVKTAAARYPFCQFAVGDAAGEIGPFDVIFSSNTLEHMSDPRQIMENFTRWAGKHILLLLPLHDTFDYPEHFCSFDEGFFPQKINDFALSYVRFIDCEAMHSPYWSGEQLFLIYSARQTGAEEQYLSDLLTNEDYYRLKETFTEHCRETSRKEELLSSELAKASEQIRTIEAGREKSESELAASRQELAASQQELAASRQELAASQQELAASRQELTKQRNRETEQNRLLEEAEVALEKEKVLAAEREKELRRIMEAHKAAEAAACGKAEQYRRMLEEARSDSTAMLDTCYRLLPSRAMKVAHFLSRWKHQRRHPNRQERRAFWRWLRTRLRCKPDSDHRYNPLFQLLEPLEDNVRRLDGFLREDEKLIPATIPAPVEDRILCRDLAKPYTCFDVVIFSVIDYDFRFQRPQQIADHFAALGHRVFYINANFSADGSVCIRQKKEGLWLVTLPNTIHPSVYSTNFHDEGIRLLETLDGLIQENGIRDALLLVDYPTWGSGAAYLKKKYGFRMVTDYMDDFGGFENAEQSFIEQECIRLLRASDLVIASSEYLARQARRFSSRVETIRNGTEYAHFRTAAGKTAQNGKKVIGYYGAISHWFDIEKIEALSARFPGEEIVLVGDVTAHRERLEALSNVRLTGEVPYRELPEYLAEFDVCLIPFDTATNLIKATNPVKFYEYLSAGKKVVATEIPELEPFRDRYVYLANDKDRFCEYVGMCLRGEDSLAEEEDRMKFAAENDWEHRLQQFCTAAETLFPQVSIIVLCYNQLEYTKKCVASILENTAYPNYEIVLVDNCSTDGTASWLREVEKENGRIKAVINTENRGFAGGNNDGIRSSEGDYIVLLNNDTLVTRGWLTGLLKKFDTKRKVGIAGPVTNSIGNEAMINVSYTTEENMPEFAYTYTAKHMGENYPDIHVLAMFCVMFPRKLTEEIGLLDENYGIGMFEDDDYSAAVKHAGYEIVLAEDAFVHHFGSVSFKTLESETHRKLFEKNKAYFESKWGESWVPHKYRPGLIIR